MRGFVNPLRQERPSGFPQRAALIKSWTRRALQLGNDAVVSVNELACAQPGCPPRQSVILVMTEGASPIKLAIHKGLMDVVEADILAEIDAFRISQQ
jgi:hypothetical protein